MSTFIDRTGERFGRLTVLERTSQIGVKHISWRCLCECGQTITTHGDNLVAGRTTSCGCLRSQQTTARNRIPGVTFLVTAHPLYETWTSMRKRCRNSACKDWFSYGGRGISVCAEWDSFAQFAMDMGARPAKGYSLDRIDNDGNYEPGNCRWATASQQRRNQHRVA